MWIETMKLRLLEHKVLPLGYTVAKTERVLQQKFVWHDGEPNTMAADLLPQHTREEWRDVPLVVLDEPYIPTSGDGNNP
jgi:hypothetical protein